jgi:RHS repeat-associated protein
VRLITDVNGNDIGEQGSFPFGESWYQNNTTTKWLFTSYQRDSESGLDYAMARYYDSRMGSFCSADPVEGNPNDPQTWNRYAYARNNPVNVADASGKSWVSILLDILSVALPIALPEAFPAVFSFSGSDLWFVGPIYDPEIGHWVIMGLLVHSESSADIGAFAADLGQAANAPQQTPNPFSKSPQFQGAKDLSQKPKCRGWLTNLAQTAGANLKGSAPSPEESQYFADQIKAIPSTLDATPTSYQPITDPSPAEGFKTNAEVNLSNPSSMTLYKGFFNETFLGSQSQIVLHEAVHLVLRYSDRQLAQAATGKIFPDTAQGRSEASSAWHDKLKKNCS